LVDVPAAVVCATCGGPDCTGCAVEETTNLSGVVAFIPWERPGVPVWRRLWQTATLVTVHARTFFSALPDGDTTPALAFAWLAETFAVSGLALGGSLLALLCLPSLPALLLEDAALRGLLLRGCCAGIFLLVAAMVGLHVVHGIALDFAARRYGGRRAGRGLRFGLYACGWDLVTLPLGLLTTAWSDGLGAARRAAPLGLTAPAQASEAYLIGVHGLSPESAHLAGRRAAYFTFVPVLLGLVVAGLIVALTLR
jgi:hypothetical protein